MKLNVVAPLSLAALAAAAPAHHEKRQGSLYDTAMSWASANLLPKMMGYGVSFMEAAEGVSKPGKATMRPAAKRSITTYGPFKLPANKNGAKAPEAGGHGAHGGMAGMRKRQVSLARRDGPHGAGPAPPAAAEASWMDILKTLGGQKPMDPNGIDVVKRLSGGMCKDCTILSGKTDAVYKNGTRADIGSGVYLHHVVTLDVSKPVPSYFKGCGGIAGAISPFLGGAVDGFTQYYTLPDPKSNFPSGFYIKDDAFLMQTELINYQPTEQEVYIQVDIEYMDGKYGGDAAQFTLAATECKVLDQAFKPPPNTIGEIKSQVYPFTKSGKLIAMRGHMHDGGTYVNMMINDKSVCKSEAAYGGAGSSMIGEDGKEWQTITKMSTCDGPIPIKAGDNVVVAAGYDTKNHPLRKSNGQDQENMGIMTFVFVADP